MLNASPCAPAQPCAALIRERLPGRRVPVEEADGNPSPGTLAWAEVSVAGAGEAQCCFSFLPLFEMTRALASVITQPQRGILTPSSLH